MLPPNERRVLAICGLLVLAALFVLVLALGYKNRHQAQLAKATPTPDASVAAKLSTHPDFEGLDALGEYGLTKFQLQNVEYAFGKYKEQTGGKVKEVWLNPDTLSSLAKPANSKIQTVTFEGEFNNETKYKGKVDYQGFTTSRLYLYDDKNKLLYDSGNVDVYNGQ
jgi:hypothetical protein